MSVILDDIRARRHVLVYNRCGLIDTHLYHTRLYTRRSGSDSRRRDRLLSRSWSSPNHLAPFAQYLDPTLSCQRIRHPLGDRSVLEDDKRAVYTNSTRISRELSSNRSEGRTWELTAGGDDRDVLDLLCLDERARAHQGRPYVGFLADR